MALRLSRTLLANRGRLRLSLPPVVSLLPSGHIWQDSESVFPTSQRHRGFRVSPPRLGQHHENEDDRGGNSTQPNVRVSTRTIDHWKDQAKDTQMVDPGFEHQTGVQFLECLMSGILPNGVQTSLPLPTQEEVELLVLPQEDWQALAPQTTGVESTLEKIMGSLLNKVNPSPLSLVGKSLYMMKKRLWEGFVPVSANRWKEKGLDKPENFDLACEHLTAVVAAFEYMNMPDVGTRLRDTFNRVAGHLQEVEGPLNDRRKKNGHPPLNLTGLWEDFVRTKYELMTGRAHSWIISHVQELQKSFRAETPDIPLRPDGMLSFDERAEEKLTKLIEIAADADLKIWMPMDGYYAHQPPSQVVSGIHNPHLSTYRKTYSERFGSFFGALFIREYEESSKQVGYNNQTQENLFAQAARRAVTVFAAQDKLRQEIRGKVPPLPRERWIQMILNIQTALPNPSTKGKEHDGLGFVIYRLTHNMSDADWMSFKEQLGEHLAAWGDGVDGADEIKGLLKLHWYDSKELGFEANTIDCAKKHFTEMVKHETLPTGMNPFVFLAVDRSSFRSYTDNELQSDPKAMFPGDFQGHLLAVNADAVFDAIAPAEAKGDQPAFTEHIRILGSLVWSELFAMLHLPSFNLHDLSVLALEHPHKVYTGPTVPSQRAEWEALNTMRTSMMNSFIGFLEKKDPKAAETVRQAMMDDKQG